MFRLSAPGTARPAPVEWQAAVLKKIESATSELQVAEAKRMGSALAGMTKKETLSIKVGSEPANPVQQLPYK